MEVFTFLGRIALIILIFLLLNIDYLTVFYTMFEKLFENNSLWLNNQKQSRNKKLLTEIHNTDSNKKKSNKYWNSETPQITRIPGFHHASTALLNLDDQIEEDTIEKLGLFKTKIQVLEVLKEHCLPKLICEMSATPHKNMLSTNEKELLNLIRQSTVMVYGTVTSKYHYAAHMGQLIMGIEGQGCHNFYPSCPFQSLQVLKMIRRSRKLASVPTSSKIK